MSEAATREREVKRHWAEPGSRHDMVVRWAKIGRDSVLIQLPMSRPDMADFLGLTIETVSRTLTRLAKTKTILIVPDGVRLMDTQRMAEMAAA